MLRDDFRPDSDIDVLVTFSPEAHHTLFDPVHMENELKKTHGSGVCVDLFPGANLRKKSSLQRGQISISSRAVGYNQKPLYLVVTCSRKWAKQGEIDMQRYALIVSINHSNPEVDLYNQLKLRTQIAQRIRIR